MRRFLVISLFGLGLLPGCADFPDLNTAIGQTGGNGPYPSLVQFDGVVRPDAGEMQRGENVAKTIAARANGLRRRARSLRGPIIEPQIRRHMAAALARHPIANTR